MVTLLEAVCMVLPGGERVERAVWLMLGRVVQVIRYDGNNSSVLVAVGRRAEVMPLRQVGNWIRERL